MNEVFECPECRHICMQWRVPVKVDLGEGGYDKDPEIKLWQCDHCWVIYTEGYRRRHSRKKPSA